MSNLLERSDRARTDPETAQPFHLWTLAERETSSTTARQAAYRHAMIHAGYLIDAKTKKPFTVCPDCARAL